MAPADTARAEAVKLVRIASTFARQARFAPEFRSFYIARAREALKGAGAFASEARRLGWQFPGEVA